MASVPVAVIVTGAFHQPAWSAGRLAAIPVIAGGVASYLMTVGVSGPAFPALSRHWPLTDADPLSGPAYVFVSQLSMFEVASVAVYAMSTGWFHQPLLSAG